MKTTLEIDDELLMEAKLLAVRRKTTLRAIVESALRREIHPPSELENPDPEKFEMGPLGFFVLKRRPGEKITLEQIQAVEDELDEVEARRAIHPRRA